MIARVLFAGMCVVASQALAQTLPSGADSPVSPEPMTINQMPRPDSRIPEVVRQPNEDDNLARSSSVADPEAALQAPVVDLRFMRAIRLDWDKFGGTAGVGAK
jgi:hypothetical protein